MAIKCLISVKQATQYFFQYTLDDTKTLTNTDGSTSPDPAFIVQYAYPLTLPAGMAESDYLTQLKNQMNLYNQNALAALTPPPNTPPQPLTGF